MKRNRINLSKWVGKGLALIFITGLVAGLALTQPVQAIGYEYDLGSNQQNLVFRGMANDAYLSEPAVPADVNGDGIKDLLVGAMGTSENGLMSGGAYLFLGRTTYPSALDTSSANVKILGANPNDLFGHTVATGDINNDGYADMIVGGDQYANDRGAVYVFMGRSTFPSVIDLANGGEPNLMILGQWTGSRFGRSLATGDVDGDGYDDILIGSYYASPGGRNQAGAVYLIRGGPTYTPSNYTLIDLSTHQASLTIYGQAGGPAAPERAIRTTGPAQLLFEEPASLTAAEIGDRLGRSVAMGDLNNDGFDDIIAGSYGSDANGLVDSGRVLVFYGSSAYAGSPKVYDLAAGLSSASVIINGIDAGDQAGFFVASGNLNGDAYDDLLATAYISMGYGNIESETGEAYAVFGGNLSGTLSFANANVTVYGGAVGDRLGRSIASADVNGDGFSDILVGASRADPYERLNAGKAYVIFGGSSMSQMVLLRPPSQANVHVFGASSGATCDASNEPGSNCADETGRSISGGDINGDGIDDLIVGSVFADNGTYADAGAINVIFGSRMNLNHRIYLPSVIR